VEETEQRRKRKKTQKTRKLSSTSPPKKKGKVKKSTGKSRFHSTQNKHSTCTSLMWSLLYRAQSSSKKSSSMKKTSKKSGKTTATHVMEPTTCQDLYAVYLSESRWDLCMNHMSAAIVRSTHTHTLVHPYAHIQVLQRHKSGQKEYFIVVNEKEEMFVAVGTKQLALPTTNVGPLLVTHNRPTSRTDDEMSWFRSLEVAVPDVRVIEF
jgi:hypothetical protein